jgi:NAD(P)H dehydrogenase (quinone)
MIVVTGASGQLGRAIALALAERVSPGSVRLATRDPGKIADLAAKGFKTAEADFDRPETLERAFAGADTVLIISGDAPNDVRIRQHRRAIDAAKAAGVGRVVYTSFINISSESLFPFAAIHADSEAYLKASGLPFTILRNGQYAENINLSSAKASGKLASPGLRGKVAYITRADIAAATAAVLSGESHAGKTYELTGPEALDLTQVAEVLGGAWGKPVEAVEIGAEDFSGVLASYGLPPFLAKAVTGVHLATGAGEYAVVSDDAAKLARRPIEPVSAWLKRA